MQRHPQSPDRGRKPTISPPASARAARASRPDATGQFLHHAAASAARDGIDLEAFMDAAWSAFVDARPGLRDALEQVQLVDHLGELRRAGKLGKS